MPVDYTPRGRLAHLRIGGKALSREIHDAVTTALLELTTTEASQLTITLRDEVNLALLRKANLKPGTEHDAGDDVDYADLALELRALEVATGPLITLTARSRGIGKLKRAKGGKVWRDLSPTAWARQEARAAGLAFVGQSSPSRHHIDRKAAKKGQPGESSWDVLTRLAREEGFIAFEAAGTLYFGTPTYLTTHASERLTLEWSGRGTDPRIVDVPNVRRSADDTGRGATVNVGLTGELGDDVRPGNAIDLRGVPGFRSAYLVTSVTFDVAATSPVAVAAETPSNPTPEPPTSNPDKPTKAHSTVKRKTPATTDSSGGPARQPASTPSRPAKPASIPWEDRRVSLE